MATIGTLKETSLHASLKQLYSRPGDLLEEKVGNSIIDIVRKELLIEVQTGSFTSLKAKLDMHLCQRPVRIVYPIAVQKTILRIASNNSIPTSRKSPKKGRLEELFYELVRITKYIKDPKFSLEVALIEEEIVFVNDGKGSWRRKGWSIADRRLSKIIGYKLFEYVSDYASLLPLDLPNHFTSQDLAIAANMGKNLAGKMLYCLRAIGVIELVGKSGRSNLYIIT